MSKLLEYMQNANHPADVYIEKASDDSSADDSSSSEGSGFLSGLRDFLEHPFQGSGTVIAPNYTPRPLDDSVYSDIPGTPVASGQFGDIEDESVRDERMKESADYMAANWPRLYGTVVAADEGLANVVGGIQNAVGGGNGILTNVQRAEEGMQNYRDQWNNEYGDSYFLNPNKFATDAGSGIGSTVPIMALSALMPGAAVAGGTRALTAALSRAGLGRLAMSKAGQALIADTVRSPISSLADSLSEYGTVVNDMMQSGMSEDEARRRAIPMFFKNMALDTFTVPLELGVMKGGKGIATGLLGRGAEEGIGKSLAKGAARTGMLAGASGLTEGYQEGAQNALENDVQGKRDGSWYNPFTWTNEDWQAARGGFVGGALMGIPGNVAAGFHPEARQAPLSAESREQAQSIKDTLSHGKPKGMSNAAYNAYIELANSGNPDLIKQAASSLESFQESQGNGSSESTDDAATEAYKDYEAYDQKETIADFLDNNTVEQIGGEDNYNWLVGVLRNGTPEEVQKAYNDVIAAEKATAEQEAKNRPARSGGSVSPNTGNAMVNAVIQAANDSGVDPRLALAIAARESGGDDINAIHMPDPHDGIYGIMQAQDETVADLGLDSQYPDWKTDPYQNAMVGMAILKSKIANEDGDVWAGVRDYNGAGEEAEQYRQLVKNNYDNMGDIGNSGNVEAPSEAFYDLSDAMNPQVDGMDPNTMAKMNLLARDFYQKYGHRLLVTSLKRNGDGSSYHDEGHAFDFSDDFLEQNPDARDWLVQQGEKYGLKGLDEFSHPVATTDGGNVHFTDHGGPVPGGASGAVAGKITSDDGQFDRELDQAAQEAKNDMDRIQAQSDQAMNEIMNDDSAEKTAQEAQEDAESAQKQAEESQQSAQDDVVPDVAQTIRDTSSNIDEINTLDGMFTKDGNGNDKFIDTPENRDYIKTNYKDEIDAAVKKAMQKTTAPKIKTQKKEDLPIVDGTSDVGPAARFMKSPHARLGNILADYDRNDPKFKGYMGTFRHGTDEQQAQLADQLQQAQEQAKVNSTTSNATVTTPSPANPSQQAVQAPKPAAQNTPTPTQTAPKKAPKAQYEWGMRGYHWSGELNDKGKINIREADMSMYDSDMQFDVAKIQKAIAKAKTEEEARGIIRNIAKNTYGAHVERLRMKIGGNASVEEWRTKHKESPEIQEVYDDLTKGLTNLYEQATGKTLKEQFAEKAPTKPVETPKETPTTNNTEKPKETPKKADTEEKKGEVKHEENKGNNVNAESEQVESKDKESTHAEESSQGDVQAKQDVNDATLSIGGKIFQLIERIKPRRYDKKAILHYLKSVYITPYEENGAYYIDIDNFEIEKTIKVSKKDYDYAVKYTKDGKWVGSYYQRQDNKEIKKAAPNDNVQEEVSKFHNVLDDEKSTPKQVIDAYKSVVDKVIANANGSRKNAKIGDKIVTDEYQSLTNSKHWDAFMKEDGGRNWHEAATINAGAHKTLRAIIKTAGKETAPKAEQPKETKPTEQPKEKAAGGFTDDEIKTLTDRGFNRWTKKSPNGKVMDRLYIDPEYLGLELTRYKSGNISSAKFNGETISNSEARRIEGTKCYVDIATKEVVCDREDLKQAAQEVVDNVLSKEKPQVLAQAETKKAAQKDSVQEELTVKEAQNDADIRFGTVEEAEARGRIDIAADDVSELFDRIEGMDMPERLDMSDEKKQASIRKAGQQLTRSKEDLKAEIKDAFPNAKEIKDEGDRMTFTMPNGSHIVVDLKNEILLTDKELAQAKKDHHIDDNGNVIVEGYAQLHGKDAYMALSQGSRENTGFHEAYHLAEGAVLTDREKAAIKKAIPDAEKRADKYAEWVEARKHGRGTAWGKLFQKIKDFAAKMKKIFTGAETVNDVFRQIESGEVWERGVNNSNQRGSYSVYAKRKLKEDMQAFAKKIDDFMNHKLSSNEYVRVMDTPLVFDLVGEKHLPIYISPNVLNKILNGKHHSEISSEMLKEIPRRLADPMFILRAINHRTGVEDTSSKIIVIDLKDKNGATIMIPFIMEQQTKDDEKIMSNLIKSVYGRTTDRKTFTPNDAWYLDKLKKGDALYVNKKRTDHWLTGINTSARTHSGPLVVDSFNLSNIIADETDLGKLKKDNPTYYSIREQDQKISNEAKKRFMNHIEVARKQVDENAIGVHRTLLQSPSRIAEKKKYFKPFFKMADDAMNLLTKLRADYQRHLDSALDLSKKDKASLQELLWSGDMEGKEYTREELREQGYNEQVIDSYWKIRNLFRKAYNQLNETRKQAKTKTGHFSGRKLDELRHNKFVEILRETDQDDGSTLVSYKEYGNWQAHYLVNEDELKSLENDDNIQILEKVPTKEGPMDGQKHWKVITREGVPDIHDRKGYVPHFFHEYMVRFVDSHGKATVISSGRTIREATKNAIKWQAENEEMLKKRNEGDWKITISPKVFDFGEIGLDESQYATTVGDKDFYRMEKKIADKHSLTLHEAKEMLDGMVKKKGRHRFFGNFLRRTGADGYEQEIEWVLRHYFNSTSRYVAMESKFKPQAISLFERLFGRFDNEYHGLPNYIKEYINDINGNPSTLEKQLNDLLNAIPAIGKWVNAHVGDRAAVSLANSITNKISIAKLGFLNVSSAMLNILQIANAAAYTGNISTLWKALLKGAHRKYSLHDLKILRETNVLNDIGLDSGAGYGKFSAGKWANRGMILFKESEGIVRRGVTLTAYETARKRGMSHEEAIRYAKDVNRKSNFDYGVHDAPGIFRRGSIFSQIFLQFKKYPIKQLEAMKDFLPFFGKGTTKKQKAIFWGTYFAMAGLFQIPFANILGLLIMGITGDDPEKEAKKSLIELAENYPSLKPLAKIGMYGIGTFANIDITSRVGIGDAVPDDLQSLFGPAASTLFNVAKSAYGGDNWTKQVRNVSPGLGNLLMAAQGNSVGKRGRVNQEYTTPYQRLLRGMGFQSTDESDSYLIQSILSSEKKKASSKKQQLIDEYIANPTGENARKLKNAGIKPSTVKAEQKKKKLDTKGRTESTMNKKDKKQYQYLLDW